MSRVYKNMAIFDLARDDAHGINAFGMWYRNDAMRYFVAEPSTPSMHEFSTAQAALQSFNLLCDKADEEAAFQARALNDEQPD